MTVLLGSTFAYSVLSAFFPFLNVEAYLVLVASQTGTGPALPLAVVAACGQALGKLFWYEAARRGSDSAWMRKRLAKPAVRARYDSWLGRAEGRPRLVVAVLLTASLVGLPPLLLVAPLAGALHLNRLVFVGTVVAGRSTQFFVILQGIGHLVG